MTARYSARLSPFGPETVWSLDGAMLTQQRGKRRSQHPLTGLTRFSLAPASGRRPHPSLRLWFGAKLVAVPSAGFGRRGVEAHAASFAAFARALAAAAAQSAPKARFTLASASDRRAPLIWSIALLAAGAAGMLLTALSSVVGGLGLTLAAWLTFAALLLGCALPWLGGAKAKFDPLAIPDALLF